MLNRNLFILFSLVITLWFKKKLQINESFSDFPSLIKLGKTKISYLIHFDLISFFPRHNSLFLDSG